jgi:hypothetical protein
MSDNMKSMLAQWQALYRDPGITADFTGLKIPAKKRGFDRLIVVPQGIKIQQAYDSCARLFPCWKYTDASLDEIGTVNDRDPSKGSYAIWIRERVEADEEWKNKSADQLKERGILGITLLERLLYEMKFFKETGRHLDVKNVTLCVGSRYRDGHVLSVNFSELGGKVDVDWYHPGFAYGNLRTREVVS